MKNRRQFSLWHVALFLLAQSMAPPNAFAQTRMPTLHSNNSAPNRALYTSAAIVAAQIDNEKAQAEYYKEQIRQLRQEGRYKKSLSIREFVLANPGVLSAIAAAIAALIALLSFFFNYRATIQREREAQFQEALKRSGDKDSLAVRASAANQLAQLGSRVEGRLTLRFELSKDRIKIVVWRRRLPFYEAALDQLIVSVQLEENPVVLQALERSLIHLGRTDKLRTTNALAELNRRLQSDLVRSLSANYIPYFIEHQNNPDTRHWWSFAYCKSAADSLSWDPIILKVLVQRQDNGYFEQISAQHRSFYNVLLDDDKQTWRQDRLLQMITDGQRLRASIRALEGCLDHTSSIHRRFNALRRIRWIAIISANISRLYKSGKQISRKLRPGATTTPSVYRRRELNLDRVLLSHVSLGTVEIADISLQRAQLYDAKLMISNLKGADLRGIQVHYSHLFGVNLEGVTADGSVWQDCQLRSCNMQNASFSQAVCSRLDKSWSVKTTMHHPLSLSYSNLQGTDLRFNNCEGMFIRDAKCDDKTQPPTTWWKADFSRSWELDDPEPDLPLLDLFFKSAPPSIDWNDSVKLEAFLLTCHESTRAFFRSKMDHGSGASPSSASPQLNFQDD